MGKGKMDDGDLEFLGALGVSLTNQAPTAGQVNRIEGIREIAREFGYVIVKNVPGSPQRTLAVRKLEESVMWAVKAIVLEGRE